MLLIANEYGTDEYEVSNFIYGAITSKEMFNRNNLIGISSLCDGDTVKEIVISFGILLNKDKKQEFRIVKSALDSSNFNLNLTMKI